MRRDRGPTIGQWVLPSQQPRKGATLAHVLRDEFIRMYEERDVLLDFQELCRRQLGPGLSSKMPDLPDRGSFDLESRPGLLVFFFVITLLPNSARVHWTAPVELPGDNVLTMQDARRCEGDGPCLSGIECAGSNGGQGWPSHCASVSATSLRTSGINSTPYCSASSSGS